MEVQKRLTLEGCIVISVGLFGHSGDEEVWKPGTKEMLDDMHLRKIDMADEIYVINVGGYIGESTRREIAYAEKTGKKVNSGAYQSINKTRNPIAEIPRESFCKAYREFTEITCVRRSDQNRCDDR